MLREDANRLSFRPAVLLKRIRYDALDRVAQPFELRLPFVGKGALLTVQVVQRATAYFTIDDSCSVHHRKQKHHPLSSITHEVAPRRDVCFTPQSRHQRSRLRRPFVPRADVTLLNRQRSAAMT